MSVFGRPPSGTRSFRHVFPDPGIVRELRFAREMLDAELARNPAATVEIFGDPPRVRVTAAGEILTVYGEGAVAYARSRWLG